MGDYLVCNAFDAASEDPLLAPPRREKNFLKEDA
jgi:hypothetical protein